MAGGINPAPMKNYSQEIYDWIKNPANPVLYHYYSGNADHSTTNWTTLNNYFVMGQEHIEAYRLWNYWQSIDTNTEIAIFKVAVGATSLHSFWNPGGRDRDPYYYNPNPKYFLQGDGYGVLSNRLVLAMNQLTELGYTNRNIEAFMWYQGEGDAYSSRGGDNYSILFNDLVNGWEDRNTNDFPNDDKSKYGGSVREILGLTNLPAIVARISWNIKGSTAWGNRSSWEPFLIMVRDALTNYAGSHPDSAWVDVDDIPLADYYHYSGENYCEIGDRFAQKILNTLYSNNFPRVELMEPTWYQGYQPWQRTNISCFANAYNAAGDSVTNLNWISSEDGAFGTGNSVILEGTSWETRVTSVGSANEGESSWVYTTNQAKKITVEYTDSNGFSQIKFNWIKQIPMVPEISVVSSLWSVVGMSLLGFRKYR